MPDYSVKATDAFEQDLVVAFDYYKKQAGQISASKFLDEYDLTIEHLSAMPSAAVKLGTTGMLWCPVGSFPAVFSIDEVTSTVYLLRLYYMTSDWKRRILEEGIAHIAESLQFKQQARPKLKDYLGQEGRL